MSFARVAALQSLMLQAEQQVPSEQFKVLGCLAGYFSCLLCFLMHLHVPHARCPSLRCPSLVALPLDAILSLESKQPES